MNRFEQALEVLLVLLIAGACFSCGKSTESEKSKETETSQRAQPSTSDVISEDEELALGDAPFSDVLARAGYEATFYRRFPAPVPGKKGSVVVYQAKRGKKEGGVLYFEEKAGSSVLAWHWFFENPPVSATPVEINEDGLWDLRVETKDGGRMDFIQDGSFTLFGGEREDRIALNGISSDPIDPKYPFWHCFDGDTATAWIAVGGGGNDVFMELQSPLGLSDGILSLQSYRGKGPKECEIRADGREVQRLQLTETSGQQLVQLDPAVIKAKTIRLVVKSSYGENGEVAIAELAIR